MTVAQMISKAYYKVDSGPTSKVLRERAGGFVLIIALPSIISHAVI